MKKAALFIVACLSLASSVNAATKSVAVFQFKVPAKCHGGAVTAQDVFVTEIRSKTSLRVVDPNKYGPVILGMNKADLTEQLAIKAGKILHVQSILTGAVTEYDNTKGIRVSVKLLSTETGRAIWTDTVESKISVFGVGGGVDDQRMFRKAMTSLADKLIARAHRKLGG